MNDCDRLGPSAECLEQQSFRGTPKNGAYRDARTFSLGLVGDESRSPARRLRQRSDEQYAEDSHVDDVHSAHVSCAA